MKVNNINRQQSFGDRYIKFPGESCWHNLGLLHTVRAADGTLQVEPTVVNNVLSKAKLSDNINLRLKVAKANLNCSSIWTKVTNIEIPMFLTGTHAQGYKNLTLGERIPYLMRALRFDADEIEGLTVVEKGISIIG